MVFSNISLLFSQNKLKNKIASVRKPININVISIICHFILIIVCINYLNENHSIQFLEKRSAYGENPCFYTNKGFYNKLLNDIVNNTKILTLFNLHHTSMAGMSGSTDQLGNNLEINQSPHKEETVKTKSNFCQTFFLIIALAFLIRLRSKKSKKCFCFYVCFYAEFLHFSITKLIR